MSKKYKAKAVKKAAMIHGSIKLKNGEPFYNSAQLEAGELYEGVTDKTSVSSQCEYRMITKSDDTVNTQGS
ncbi:MAG: hypothetical protein IKC35_05290 [Clostridia bacterium]|nr:hypothetical protein [Clostridia bacterium]